MADETIKIIPTDSDKQVKYYAASENCNSLGTLVPKSMAMEQKRFNQRMKTDVGDIDEYVAEKLHYNSVSDLCGTSDNPKFSREQIDAIATAIYNHEKTGNAIIIADQTGVGKGRIACGLIRYAVLEKKVVPFFITEKKHLLHDIYRDLVDIGFDAGVPIDIVEIDESSKKTYTDQEILELIEEDIKEDELRIEYDFDEFGEKFKLSNLLQDDYVEVLEEIIELYKDFFSTDGNRVFVPNKNRQSQLENALAKGLHEVKPFTPFPFEVKDKDGNILYKNVDKDIKSIFKKGSLPSDYKLIAFPYSQISTPYTKTGELTDKSKFILKMAKNAVVIMDESHAAAGFESNTAKMIQSILASAQMTTFLSATFAKRPENMFLYASQNSIGETGMSAFALKYSFEKGDLALQEAVSSELVRTGQLIRREKEIMGKTDYYYESDSSEIGVSQVNRLNKVAVSFEKISQFTQLVKDVLDSLKKSGEASKDYKFAGNVNRFKFQLFQFFLLGLKVEQTTKEAIEQLKSGRKVVISVANTLESAFKNVKKDFILDTPYSIGDEIPNDFKLFLAYLLDYTLRIALEKEVPDGNKVKKEREIILIKKSSNEIARKVYELVADKYETLLNEILDSDIRTPISPIDVIKDKIKSFDFKVDEVTGRTLNLEFENEDYSKGKLSKIKTRLKEEIIRDFNTNKVDCIILNQSGAVGVSMHAVKKGEVDIVLPEPPTSLKNKKEVKQRCMIITQMELDINKEVQKLGRINRTGQVYPPLYKYIISTIPSESRLTALNQKKLSSLSANVSSNQSQSDDLFSVDDFYSKVALEPFNETMKDMMQRFRAKNKKDIEEFTKSLYFSPYDFQYKFYNIFSQRLNNYIKFLKDNGLYFGSVALKDYKAREQEIYPFIIGNNDSLSSFGRHSVLEIAKCTEYDIKFLEYDVSNAIVSKLNSAPSDSESKDFNNYKAFEKYYDDYFSSMLDIIKTTYDSLTNSNKDLILINKNKIKELQSEKKKENKLKEAIELDDKIKQLNKDISEKTALVSTFLLEQKIDEMNNTLKEVQELQKELGISKSKLEKNTEFQELLEKRDEFLKIDFEIEKNEKEIDRLNKRNESLENDFKQYQKNTIIARDYYTNIGKIFYVTLFEENEEWGYDENDDYVIKNIEYITVYENKPFVLTGFSFTGDKFSNPNLSSMSISLMGVTTRETIELSKIHKKLSEKDIQLKRKNTFNFSNSGTDYLDGKTDTTIGAWNKVASLVDTGYEVKKYIITGSLLKCFNTLQGIGINGTIIKYTTADEKNRIGIELSDKSRDAFLERLSKSEYIVYFDMILSNYRKLVIDEYEKNRSYENGMWNEILGYKDKIFIQTINNEYDKMTSSSEDFIKTLKVRILSEKPAFCDYILQSLNDIGVTNALMLGKRNGEDVKSKINGKYYGDDYSYSVIWNVDNGFTGKLFKNIFPSVEVSYMTLLYNKQIELSYGIEIEMADFLNLIEYLKQIKQIFTTATSNVIIENNKDFYIFEQNADEIQGFEITASNDYIPQDMLSDEVEMELDEIIDSLIEHLR